MLIHYTDRKTTIFLFGHSLLHLSTHVSNSVRIDGKHIVIHGPYHNPNCISTNYEYSTIFIRIKGESFDVLVY